MLDHLKVLDLSDERGLLTGRLLADLGADVVQVEPSSGSTARAATPLSADGTSLYWASYAANKRGIVLDLEPGPAGAEALARFDELAAVADVVLTSATGEWLRARGLHPEQVTARHPHLVHVSVTPFGLTGPKAEWVDSDLVVWAAGGPLEPHRDPDSDRPPLRVSVPQTYLHAAADAAAGALVALRERRLSNRGQIVDVSAQEAIGVATLARVLADPVGDAKPEWHQQPVKRTDQSGSGAATPNRLKKWRVADGMVELHLSMGPASGGFTNNLFGWLSAEGAIPAEIAEWDWRVLPARIESGELTEADLDRVRGYVREFLAGKTKAEVVEAALAHRLLCMAIYDISDLLASPQLAARGYWETVPVDGAQVRIPANWAQFTGPDAAPFPGVRRPAPLIGEHTDEVSAEWLEEGSRGVEPLAATHAAADGASERPQALAGLKVLDLSWVVAGPLIARALADFGADVVRVESGTRIETARLMQPFHGGVAGPENSALFGNCNAGKRGLTLDLKSVEGQDVVRGLVAWADVVVESFSPGQMDRWGLGYEALREINPGMVMLSTSIAGQTGPWTRLAGFGNVGSALSGFQNLVGWADGLPLGPFGPYTDYVGPRFSLTALLAALEHRDRTCHGMRIDVSQLESGIFFLAPQVAHADLDGTVAQRRGNDDERFAPHGVYRAAEVNGRVRFVAIAVTDDTQWQALCAELDRPDLAARADLVTAPGRRAAAAELDQLISAWTAERDADEVTRLLQDRGVPAHAAVGTADYAADAQLAHRGHLVTLPSERHGTTVVEGPRYLLSRTPGRPQREAPTLGRDNEEVLTDLLGLPADQVRALHEKGVLR